MTETLKTMAMQLYQRQAFKSLKLFKKHKKKSWAALGINPEMEALIMKGGDTIYGTSPAVVLIDEINVKDTVTGRNPSMPPQSWRLDRDMPRFLKYTSREIHRLKGQTSHGTIAVIAQVVHQEKFRSDPRFPLFQMAQRAKRYKEIFAGRPYLPIFG